MNRTRDGNQNGSSRESSSPYWVAGAVAAGAAVAGGLYWLLKGEQSNNSKEQKGVLSLSSTSSNSSHSSVSQYLNSMSTSISDPSECRFTSRAPPDNPCISNLNALLSDIHIRYIQIKVDDFTLHYKIFDTIFRHLHQKMKDVDPYYRKYSSTVQFAGSHFDNLRIKKPDEFDMDIVIDLPLNRHEHSTNPRDSDICLEPREAGYVNLKMGVQFQRLPMRDGVEWLNNKAAYEWMDDRFYLQRSKFSEWFKSVANRALNTFERRNNKPLFCVGGVPYLIGTSESGPAFTMIIENKDRGFRLDVDVVPALRLPEARWPPAARYRRMPLGAGRGDWLLVAKPAPGAGDAERRRGWRLALHNQERGLLHDSHNLRQAVRLLKKLRDSLGMKEIASYYIKTLFFWEVVERDDKSFWQKNSPAFLFKLMVGRLHAALVNKKIPYFWNKDNNLIAKVPERRLFEHAAKLVPLMQVLEDPKQYKLVAKYLLEPHEFRDYNAKFLHI